MKKFAAITTVLLIMLCAIHGVLRAQLECSIKHFNTANGLSQNTITGMAFDKIGYLWIGTQNGLVRYDGTNFKVYLSDPNTTVTNGSNTVLNIFSVSADSTVLIRMRDGIVYTTKDGRPVLYSDAIKNTPYFYELEGRFPNLALFGKFNLQVADLIRQHKWNAGVRAVLPVNNTDFIVLGEQDNVFLYYQNGVKQKEIRVNGHFNRFLKSGEYNLMLDDNLQLYLFDKASVDFKVIPVRWADISEGISSTSRKVFLWDKVNDQSYCFYNAVLYKLRFDTVSRVMKFLPQFSIAEKGHFWTNIIYDNINSTYFLSTYTEGLFQVKMKQIQTFSLNDKIVNGLNADNAINYALLRTSDSTVLTTTGFEFTSTGTHKTTVKKKGNISGNRETIARLGDTAILCVQRNRLVYYLQADGFQQSRTFNTLFDKNYSSFVTLLKPEGDSVWVCSDAGIFSLRQNNVRVLFYRKMDQQSLYFGPRLFYRISENEVLFSNNLGLFKLRTSPPHTIDTFPEMKDKQVRGIAAYKNTLLLSVYKHGLFLLTGKAFSKVPTSENQPELTFCHAVYIDKSENVWIPTDNGLFRSSITGVIESVSKQGSVPFFFNYGEKDGIENTEFNGGGTPSFATLTNGQFFYPSMGGIVTFNPSSLDSSLLKGPVMIERIVAGENETDLLIADSIYLKANLKFLGIDLSVPHFGKPGNLVLEYNQDNKGWKKIPVSPSPRIMLYDLSAGYHQLLIRKRTGFENADYVYKTLIITRAKSIYQQVWFYPALTASFVLLLLLIIRLRTESINRQRRQLQTRVDKQTSELTRTVEVKELLINIISQDMMAPLKHVSFIAGVLRKYPGKDAGKATDTLADIKATAEKILTGSQGIINYMKYNSSRVVVNRQAINLYDVINEVSATFLTVIKKKNIRLINDVNQFIFVDMDETIFGIILNNIISNAIKYADGNSVQIFLEPGSEIKEEIILKIKDDGIGMSNAVLNDIRELIKGNLPVIKAADKSGTGLGYILISELTRIHGLSVEVESELNKGTTISISIPNNLVEPDAL